LGVGLHAPTPGYAVKIAEKRVHNSNEGHASKGDAASGFILRSTMHPYPVQKSGGSPCPQLFVQASARDWVAAWITARDL